MTGASEDFAAAPGDTAASYPQRVWASFGALKEIAGTAELEAAAVPLGEMPGALIPICRAHESDPAVIERLGRWRTRNMAVYPTQFEVTFEGTARWLRERVLDVPDRIAFFVVDGSGTQVGHVGLADALAGRRSVRLDNIMRGVDEGPRGIMSAAVRTLIAWADGVIGPVAIWLKVFSDNDVAIRFYSRLSFRPDGTIPLRLRRSLGRLSYEPLLSEHEAPDRHHLRMVLADG